MRKRPFILMFSSSFCSSIRRSWKYISHANDLQDTVANYTPNTATLKVRFMPLFHFKCTLVAKIAVSSLGV